MANMRGDYLVNLNLLTQCLPFISKVDKPVSSPGTFEEVLRILISSTNVQN